MKKRFVAIFLVLLMTISLTGCGSIKEGIDGNLNDALAELGFIVVDNLDVTGCAYNYRLVYDSETGVMYYLANTYNGGLALCPRYDENGEIMIYGGD